MAINGGSIQGVVGKVVAGTSITNAFLVALQKINYDVQGEDNVGFLFTFREEDNVELESDITDYFTEGNDAIQDQIALKPEKITLHGFIGELNNQKPGILQNIQNAVSQLTVLAPYAPQLTVAALTAYNRANQIYNAAASAVGTLEQAYDMIVGSDLQNRQQKAFAYFYKKWKARELFRVQTPWQVFENMAILSLKSTQDGETNTVSDFRITFKKMNFASTISLSSTVLQGRLQQQSASLVNQGVQNPGSIGPLSSVLGDQSAVNATVFQ